MSTNTLREAQERCSKHARWLVHRAVSWRVSLVVVLLVSAAGWTTQGGVAVASAPRSTVAIDPQVAGLSHEIEALLASEPGVYGVVVMTPDGQTLYSRNSEVLFVAASLYKLLVMATIFEYEAAGRLTLDEPLPTWETVADALYAMIAHSDNDASHALLDRVGGPAVVNETARRLGMESSRVFIDPSTLPEWPLTPAGDSTTRATATGAAFVQDAAAAGGVDITTPRDVATFFRLLLDGKVVSADASDAMLALLEQQEISDRLPVLLPPDTNVAHKTGNLPGVVHDAGIITTPHGPLIVAVLAEAMPDEDQAAATIQRLALAVYETSTPSRLITRPGRDSR